MRSLSGFLATGVLALSAAGSAAAQVASPSAMSSAMPAMAASPAAMAAPAIEATPIPLPAKPNFAPLKYFLGTWACSTKSARRPTPQLATVTTVMDPGGRWIKQTTVTKPTVWYPYVVTGTDLYTYDADTKRWIDVGYDSMGDYGLSGSPGWTSKTLVWKDLAFTPTDKVASATDFTITKVSATKFTTETAFTTGKGRTVGVTGVCTKT